MDKWFKSKVISGHKIGRKINIPTINLDNPEILNNFKKGVYSCQVKIMGEIYRGSLYYGPRTIINESKDILEIYIFDFDQSIYGELIEFKPVSFIRPPVAFRTMDEMKKKIEEDNRKIQRSFQI